MPRAHAGALGEILHRQGCVEMLARPGEQRTETAVRRLQLQERRKLRLPAAAPMIEHELACGVLRDLLAMILGDHRERKVDAGGYAGGCPHIAIAGEYPVRLELDLGVAHDEIPRTAPMCRGAAAV